jgi:hypothetical protein
MSLEVKEGPVELPVTVACIVLCSLMPLHWMKGSGIDPPCHDHGSRDCFSSKHGMKGMGRDFFHLTISPATPLSIKSTPAYTVFFEGINPDLIHLFLYLYALYWALP